jgi:hypothetical protein
VYEIARTWAAVEGAIQYEPDKSALTLNFHQHRYAAFDKLGEVVKAIYACD